MRHSARNAPSGARGAGGLGKCGGGRLWPRPKSGRSALCWSKRHAITSRKQVDSAMILSPRLFPNSHHFHQLLSLIIPSLNCGMIDPVPL